MTTTTTETGRFRPASKRRGRWLVSRHPSSVLEVDLDEGEMYGHGHGRVDDANAVLAQKYSSFHNYKTKVKYAKDIDTGIVLSTICW